MISALGRRLLSSLRTCNNPITLLNFVPKQPSALQNSVLTKQPSCNEWTDARMRKDVRKRIVNSEFAHLKSRLQCLRKNKILPDELKEAATKDLLKLPNDCLGKKIVWRCAVTSRPRGNVYRWRVSRIVFRHLSDYNKLAGVMRAMW